jgi:6-phosphogluconolactonase
VLYAVNEVADFDGANTGAVSAFSIDPTSGALTLLNQQPSGGADPCYLVADRNGRNLLVANYTGGTVAVLPLAADGRLQRPTTVLHHAGSGPDKARQEGPHAHAITLDAAGRFAFEADLGTDRVYAYRFDADAGRLEPNEPAETALDPGSGPRHLAWHPSGRYLYALNELRSTIAVFRYDAARGSLAAIQTVTTLPAGFTGPNTAAEVIVDGNGRFLYSSNRGHDSLAVFTVDERTGKLTPAGHIPTGGRTPRHFAIDRSGRWLLVANQDSDSIAVFHLDPATGRPSLSGRLRVPKPVCVLFAGATR